MDITNRFGSVTEKVRELTDKGKGLAARTNSMLKVPPLVFGAPRQLAREPNTAWWYVPVFIQPQAMHKKRLEHCRAKLVSHDGGGAVLDMRWVELNGNDSADQLTLLSNSLYFIPVAARSESSQNRSAIITNESFIARKKVAMQLRAGRSRWALRVEYANDYQESAHSYELTVPPPNQGNGHFTLEVRYDDLE